MNNYIERILLGGAEDCPYRGQGYGGSPSRGQGF